MRGAFGLFDLRSVKSAAICHEAQQFVMVSLRRIDLFQKYLSSFFGSHLSPLNDEMRLNNKWQRFWRRDALSISSNHQKLTFAQGRANRVDVFVAAPAEIDDDDLIF